MKAQKGLSLAAAPWALKLVLCTADGVQIETACYIPRTVLSGGSISKEEREFMVERVLAAIVNQKRDGRGTDSGNHGVADWSGE